MKTFLFALITMIVLNGCIFAVGASQGICEGEGCNYSEAGICAPVIDIYKNRHSLQNKEVEEGWF